MAKLLNYGWTFDGFTTNMTEEQQEEDNLDFLIGWVRRNYLWIPIIGEYELLINLKYGWIWVNEQIFPWDNFPKVNIVAQLAVRDLRSSVSANLDLIQRETGLDPCAAAPGPLRAALLKRDLMTVPDVDKWRVPYLWRPLAERLQAHYAADTTIEDRLTVFLNSLVVN